MRLRECKVFIPLAPLVESSKSHIKGFVEGERLLIQCQMGVARKKEGECIPCAKPIVARTTVTADRLKCMFLEDWTAGGGRREQGWLKLIYLLDGYTYICFMK